MEKLKAIPRFNNHGKECQGHSNWMLDCEFTTQEERDILINVLDKHIGEDQKPQ